MVLKVRQCFNCPRASLNQRPEIAGLEDDTGTVFLHLPRHPGTRRDNCRRSGADRFGEYTGCLRMIVALEIRKKNDIRVGNEPLVILVGHRVCNQLHLFKLLQAISCFLCQEILVAG